jgi:exonuclease SbcC
VIPKKIFLYNFMSYRSEELDLRGIRLACLAGDNGHGKSALLDAITWALWGKARASSDDSLIHMGEREMEVALEFELGSNDYRVVRKREVRGKRGLSFLGVYQLHGGDSHKLAEGVREGERLLRSLLRMDYDTFINSAFILQGRADEFTERLPSERKKILGDILGLGIYEEYEALAKAQAAEIQARIEMVEGRLLAAEEEIEQEERWRKAADEAAITIAWIAIAMTIARGLPVLIESFSMLKHMEEDET